MFSELIPTARKFEFELISPSDFFFSNNFELIQLTGLGVLTDDTRLPRPELLEEVEGVCRWDKRKHKHTRSDHVTGAVAVSTVAVVVRQLIRGYAVAHVVFVPWCDKKPRKGRPRECVLTDVTRRAWVEQHQPRRKGDRVRHQDDELTHGQPAHARECQPRADPHVPEQHPQNT